MLCYLYDAAFVVVCIYNFGFAILIINEEQHVTFCVPSATNADIW